MKKFIALSMTLALLAACSEESTTPETNTPATDTPAATTPVENTETQAPVTSDPTTDTSALADQINAVASWSSYESVASYIETYESGDYPDNELHVEKQYVAEPAQVLQFTSSIGFSNSTTEQYASYEYANGGFESMDGGDFYDLDEQTVDLILTNSLPSRVQLLHTIVENATNVTPNGDTFTIELNENALASVYEAMQASFLYNAQATDLDDDTRTMLSYGMEAFHAGSAVITTDGTAVTDFALTFDLTSEMSGRATATFTEAFTQINELTEIEAPEELMMGIGVN